MSVREGRPTPRVLGITAEPEFPLGFPHNNFAQGRELEPGPCKGAGRAGTARGGGASQPEAGAGPERGSIRPRPRRAPPRPATQAVGLR